MLIGLQRGIKDKIKNNECRAVPVDAAGALGAARTKMTRSLDL